MQDTPETRELMDRIFKERSRMEKRQKLERFRRLNLFAKKGQILFAGSSLMEQFPVNELTMDLNEHLTIYNRGVGGFTTAELAEALEPCVFALEPRHLFLNIGTNDLNGPDYALSGLIERYEGILCAIRGALPDVKLYLLAYYPVNASAGAGSPLPGEIFQYRTNARIREANEAVRALAARFDAAFLDLNAPITDENGDLKREYTVEGIHMYADGYMEILKQLLPLLRSLS